VINRTTKWVPQYLNTVDFLPGHKVSAEEWNALFNLSRVQSNNNTDGIKELFDTMADFLCFSEQLEGTLEDLEGLERTIALLDEKASRVEEKLTDEIIENLVSGEYITRTEFKTSNHIVTLLTERLVSAEEKITDEAIINTVSAEYYKKTQVDDKILEQSEKVSSELRQEANEIALKVSSLTNRVKETELALTEDSLIAKLHSTYATVESVSGIDEKVTTLTETVSDVQLQLTPEGIFSKVSDKVATLEEVNNLNDSLDNLSLRVKNNTSSIEQYANEIALKVNADGIISAINMSSESVKIKSNKILLDGTTIVNGVLQGATGTFTGNLTATEGTIGGWTISYNTLGSTGAFGSMTLNSEGYIVAKSNEGDSVTHSSYYSEYTSKTPSMNVFISGSSISLNTNSSSYEQPLHFCVKDNPKLTLSAGGIYGPNWDLANLTNGVLLSGYFALSLSRIYLDNDYSLRGMKEAYDTSSPSVANSNALIHLSTSDRVIVGSTGNSADTEFHTPNRLRLKSNGTSADESRYTVELMAYSSSDVSYGAFRPSYNTTGGTSYTQLGTSNYKWRNVYATNGTIQTSDRNLKKNIASMPEVYLKLFDAIEPKIYQLLEGDRVHTGFIAQEIEAALPELGLVPEQLAFFCKDKKEGTEEEYIYSLRYQEYIAIMAAKIKQLEARLEALIQNGGVE